MTFIPPWLRILDFNTDPFSCPQAENLDKCLIQRLFVYSVFEPTYADPDFNILNFPGSTVIYGWGKTMGARWLQWWAEQKRMAPVAEFCPLVVTYDHSFPLNDPSTPIIPQHHVEPTLKAFASASLPVLIEFQNQFMDQSKKYRQNWWAFLNQYLPSKWERKVEDLPDSLLEDIRSAGEDRFPLEGELDQVLAYLATWLAELGINRVYLVIDNLTGYRETKNCERAASLVDSLVNNDQLFHIPGLYWKIFLSNDVKKKLFPLTDFPPLRYKIFPIHWGTANLIEMINQTFIECTQSQFYNLDDFCDRLLQKREPSIAEEIAALALRRPGGPPKNMLMFVGKLLQRAGQGESKVISIRIWSSFLKDIDLEIEQVSHGLEQETDEMKNAERERYVETRKDSLRNRIEQLTKDLGRLENAYDYAHDERERGHLNLEIDTTKENIEKALQEVEGLSAKATGGQHQELNEIKGSLVDMDKRVKKLEGEMEEIQVFLNAYPPELQNWAAQVINILDRAYLQEVKDVLLAVQKLPEAEMLPLVDAVQQANIAPLQADTRRGKLVEDSQRVLSQSDLTCNTRIKLSIPIIPILLNWDTELGFNGKIDLRKLWERIVERARRSNN